MGHAEKQRAVRPVKPPQANAKQQQTTFEGFRYRALLIGNNEYEHWEDLKTPVHDVEQLATILEQSYGFLEEDIVLLTDSTRRETLQAFGELKKRSRPEDRLLVYYAGHGFSESASQRGYWVPVDAADKFDYLPNEVIRKELEIIPAKHKLLIADSCFSGTFVTSQRSLGSPLDWQAAGYYVNKAADPSFQTLTSGSNEPVFDGGATWGGHSIFAYHLLSKLRNNQEPYLPSKKLGQHLEEQVANDVATSLGAKQTPIFSAIYPGHAGGEFFFLRPDAVAGNVLLQPARLEGKRRRGPAVLLIYNELAQPGQAALLRLAQERALSDLREQLESGPLRVLQRTEILSEADERKISRLMRNRRAKFAVVFSFKGQLEPQQSFLWKGMATASLQAEVWRYQEGAIEKVGSWQPRLQKLPSRQWEEDPDFRAQLLSRAFRKVIEKADLEPLQQALQP